MRMKKLDQFGQPIPDDLVLMPDREQLRMKEVHMILNVPWYECQEILMVSSFAIDWLSEADPADADINLETSKIFKIDDCLKRWNYLDGFYHA